jgi:hypothetical protein
MSDTTVTSPKLSDGQRLQLAVRNHGLALLAAITLWVAADAYVVISGSGFATVLSVFNAFAAASIMASIFHEWGHFTGARLAKSYSPMVTNPLGTFIFGFNFKKNTSRQFLFMSIGGPVANTLLVVLVLFLVPVYNAGSAMLLAVVVARLVSVLLFEVPIILRVMNGGEPEAELERGQANGSGDRGQVIGYATGLLVWILAL